MSKAADKGLWLIRLIVIKKVLLAAVLLVISLAALYGDIHYAQLSDFADTWGQADRRLLAAMAQQGAVLGPTRLIQLAVVSALYALLILVAAWGTWFGRRWGEWLLVALLALALPLEIMHALHEQSPRTFVVLGLTVLGLVVTSRRVLR
ncbi:DUF2127 domain-containing protein [Synechococcus sp. CC9605]|uniref:DUF2127 domain-containing protein n=1 Tax=Synechococcus sp. (strain CC9605) TaxID=110662 RepID=UPI00005D5D6D|nr:DUF2127 domain-containing protein [Synechococcus sp. CC9605]ABB35868.1 hypothetical protein Syncc9605_2129 [Synechococcus sp. CC9605]